VIGRAGSLLVWALLGAALVGCQIVALVWRGRFPGLGILVRRATVNPVGRWLLVLAWAWLGWHAFAR
jgi:hypothetical protein